MERKEHSLADLYGTWDDGEESVADLVSNLKKLIIYVLKQSTLITHLSNIYGTLSENKKTTVDNKVRVMGLMFNETLWDYLPDMLGRTRGG